MSNLNSTYKLAFFHFPRTGGSFMGYYIRDYLKAEVLGIGHQRYIDVKDQVEGLHSVVFVRNPFSWYVSRYFYYARPDYKTEGGLLKGCDDGLSGQEFLDKFPTFESHLIWGFENILNFSMQHCFNEMCFENEIMKISQIGKFEFMSANFGNMLKKAEIESPPIGLQGYSMMYQDQKHTNASVHSFYRDYYNSKLIKLVQKFDFEILKIFNYKF
ncbi:MAG: sulfotransferase family 2 domain-containing protein [Atribacterota bacterium]|nr:sulfotransferase family 2 domain-containing protein [Atribacterota bacterium]